MAIAVEMAHCIATNEVKSANLASCIQSLAPEARGSTLESAPLYNERAQKPVAPASSLSDSFSSYASWYTMLSTSAAMTPMRGLLLDDQG